jgi:outer membrane receptor protein involved in Fe transport
MKAPFYPACLRSTDRRGESRNAPVYRAVILLASVACGGAAFAQTNNPPAVPASPAASSPTNAVSNSTNVVQLAPTTVVGKLDVARSQIVPDLGATVYSVSQAQVASLPGGDNAAFNQVLLRAPGMVQDSAANGDLHLRGEHANIQYRINDVLLPEGISGFGQEIGTRFMDNARLITGSLPAQYGFRTAGIVDIHTKSGAFDPGGNVSMYGGSYDTLMPSFELGGTKGNLNFYVDGSYNHNDLGIENPTSSKTAIHDVTDQFKAFTYLSYIMDDTSRFSGMAGASYANFQVPNTPGLQNDPANFSAPGGNPWTTNTTFDSTVLNENQNEQNYYGVVAYQKSAGDFNLQVAAFGRVSTVHFTPDPVGDLFYNGVASDVERDLYSAGLQADASYQLGDNHTLRGGVMVMDEYLSADSSTTAVLMDSLDPSSFNPLPGSPTTNIVQNGVQHALFFGVYLQDEWKLVPKVTLNYGARFDIYDASFDNENQVSPRVNLIYQPTDATTLHAGYARYFTPPPLENVPSGNVTAFNGTANQAPSGPPYGSVKAERANYFDVGISQKLAPGLQVGVDGYYKNSVNQLDDGLFGQTLILQAFNYAEGRIHGVEFTASYTTGGFSTYANVAYSVAQGQDWNSAQFLFDPNDAAYVKNNWIYLDHDQTVTGSFGASYLWKHDCGSTRFFVDALYGSGLRTDATAPDGSNIPNGGTVPAYYTVSLGVEEVFKIAGKNRLKARLDVVNVTDNVYELRDGQGVGVNAAQYGMRRGFFGTVSVLF